MAGAEVEGANGRNGPGKGLGVASGSGRYAFARCGGRVSAGGLRWDKGGAREGAGW